MMWTLHRALNSLFDLLLWPFQIRSPWPGLVVASLATAAVLVALFSVSSSPSAIRRSRNKLLARTLELLLFQHDLRVGLTACGRIVSANLAYLWQFLKPMCLGLIPLLLLFVQMENWFERRPFRVGEPGVLTVQLATAYPVLTTPVQLQLSDAIRVDSPPVRIPSKNELAWRFVAESDTAHWADVTVAEVRERKHVVIGKSLARVAPVRVSQGAAREVFSPSEKPLAASSPVQRMEISYPTRKLFLGLTEIPWIAAALVLMMVFSLGLGRLLGVPMA